jgi:hypothetical protein
MNSGNRFTRVQEMTKPNFPQTSSIARRRVKLESSLNGFRVLNGALIDRLKAREEEVKQLKKEIANLKQAAIIKKFGDILPV